MEQFDWIRIKVFFNPMTETVNLPISNLYRFIGNDEIINDLEIHREQEEKEKEKVSITIDKPSTWKLSLSSLGTNPASMILSGTMALSYEIEYLFLEGQIVLDNPNINAAGILLREERGKGRMEKGSEEGDGKNVNDKNRPFFSLTGYGYFQIPSKGLGSIELSLPQDYKELIQIEDSRPQLPIFMTSLSSNMVFLSLNVFDKSQELVKDDEYFLVPKIIKEEDKIENEMDNNDNPIINIFTIAAGSEYEKLSLNMIMSVVENVNNNLEKNVKTDKNKGKLVKFWILDTFTTPEYHENIEKLSKSLLYSFQYEFVHYEWPKWLTIQNKFHRTVWAYKVLFLDILFPVDLQRILYVDADQMIVQGNILNLYRHDLGNDAPYGFVPFCDDKKEIDNLRFWKSGFWLEALKGKPYHIRYLSFDYQQFHLLIILFNFPFSPNLLLILVPSS